MSSANQPYHPSPDLRRLVDGALDNTLDRADMARLEQHLESDPRALQWYLEVSEIHALLPVATTNVEVPQSTDRRVLPMPSNTRWIPWVLAAAALLLVSLIIWQPWSASQGATPFATVTASIDARSANPNQSLAVNSELFRQKVEPVTGLVEISHASGVRVLLEGPASYTVMGPNSGKLEFGRLVATVPPGAKGFSVDTGQEIVVDHGTEFAIALPRGGQSEVGVFRGEVELTSLDGKQSLARLYSDHAVTRHPDTPSEVTSIPFERNKFIRTLPSREFTWDLKGVHPEEQHTFEFDVTGLIWETGEYRAIFKWMEGRDALDIEQVSLLWNGQLVAKDVHEGSTGILKNVRDNIYRLKLPNNPMPEGGRWTLTVTCRPWMFTGKPTSGLADSRGILLFESGLALSATEKDFVGRWEYPHNGRLYVREFRADGTARLTETKANQAPIVQDANWVSKDGVLIINFTVSKIVEHHILRDSDTLLFVDCPYRNARRIGK